MENGNFIVKAANLLVNQSEFNEGKGREIDYEKLYDEILSFIKANFPEGQKILIGKADSPTKVLRSDNFQYFVQSDIVHIVNKYF